MGQHDGLVIGRKNIRSLCHEMHSTKDQIFFVLDLCRFPGQLERITTEIRKLIHRILLVMMTENEQGIRHFCLSRRNSIYNFLFCQPLILRAYIYLLYK